MSWLLENWFGSKESLEQVREDIHDHLHREFYLGLSGIDHPEQSSTRVASKELYLLMNGPWDSKLDDSESELLQYIHDEIPAMVRDEVGIVPFFTQVTSEGYLLLTYIRNATDRNVLLQKLPLTLTTLEGEVVAKKTFDLMSFGPIGDMSSRPCEFLFRWSEFDKIPEQEVPLILTYKKPERVSSEVTDQVENDLSAEEVERYKKEVDQKSPLQPGQVDLQVLDIKLADNNGIEVIVIFRNGLPKRLEFTEVPIIVHDKAGDTVARVHYTLEDMKVDANSSRIWTFGIPASSIKKPDVAVADMTAFIPKARQEKKNTSNTPISENKGLLQ